VPAQAANILVVCGTTVNAQTSGTVLNADLSGTNTVTVVNTGVPADLTPYTQIYDLRYDNAPAFTVGEQTQYLNFLNAAPNNTIFMMGENGSFNARNGPMLAFVTLAGGGTIANPTSSPSNIETVNTLFRTPNNISTVRFQACGPVTSAGTGAFASTEPGGTSGCSLFFGLGALQNAPTGALVIVFDVNFILGAGPGINEVSFRQNLEAFVSSPPVAPPPAVSGGPSAAPTLSGLGIAMLALGLVTVAARKLRTVNRATP
jgi:hypothetical protein